MKRKLLLGLVLAAVFVFIPATSYAGNALCDADLNNLPPGVDRATVVKLQQSEACKDQGNFIAGPGGLISDITNVVAIFAGIAAVVMIMVGGYKFITSGGESGKVQEAKKTITWSVIGLVVIVLARSIIIFVLEKV